MAPAAKCLGAEAGPGGTSCLPSSPSFPKRLPPPHPHSCPLVPEDDSNHTSFHEMFSAAPSTPGLCHPSSSTPRAVHGRGAWAGAGWPGSFSAGAKPFLPQCPAWEAGCTAVEAFGSTASGVTGLLVGRSCSVHPI